MTSTARIPCGTPAFGLTDDQFERIGNSYAAELKSAQAALARGNIEYIAPDLDELLELFGIRLFTGARRGELAGLTAADVQIDEATAHPIIIIREDESRSRSLKTPGSARTIPVHAELIRQGFVQFR